MYMSQTTRQVLTDLEHDQWKRAVKRYDDLKEREKFWIDRKAKAVMRGDTQLSESISSVLTPILKEIHQLEKKYPGKI